MKGRITGFAAAAALWLVCAALCASANAKDGGGDGMPGAGPGTQGEISGVVQTMPATGLVGDWKIAGRTVRTDAATQFDQGDGQVGVGAMVEVQGTSRLDGSLLAARMEVRMGVGQPPAPGSAPGSGAPDDGGPGEFVGPIITLPEGGLLGLWDVGGRKVSVVSTTRLDQAHGTIAVGAMVEVNGLPDRSGIVVAGSVEVRTAPSAVPPGEVPVPGKVELAGRIESLPAAGLIGNWQVGGRAVIVTAGTMLDPGHGAFIVGASVEAKGALDTEGALKATKVETTEGNGASEPALEFWGQVVALPTGTTGLSGVWKVDDRLVNVTAATRI